MTETMDRFLTFIRKRRAEVQRELHDLDVAERIYRDSGVELIPGQVSLFSTPTSVQPRKSIKQMVLEVLDDVSPHGLTALEILDQIRARWSYELPRTSLSPQLTRLKNDGLIFSDKGVWKRTTTTDDVPGDLSTSIAQPDPK